jgi:hypothetical protein
VRCRLRFQISFAAAILVSPFNVRQLIDSVSPTANCCTIASTLLGK